MHVISTSFLFLFADPCRCLFLQRQGAEVDDTIFLLQKQSNGKS